MNKTVVNIFSSIFFLGGVRFWFYWSQQTLRRLKTRAFPFYGKPFMGNMWTQGVPPFSDKPVLKSTPLNQHIVGRF
jgi:hypothetical protein